MSKRKLVSIRKIDGIRPIEGADAIECATIGGLDGSCEKRRVQSRRPLRLL